MGLTSCGGGSRYTGTIKALGSSTVSPASCSVNEKCFPSVESCKMIYILNI